MDFFRPDGKTQVSFEYVDGKPIRINNVVVSTQHAASASQADIIEAVKRTVIRPVLEPTGLFDEKDCEIFINTTGRFVVGGPMGDCGLTGRKIIQDTYGGSGHHGGGAFSGKDPSKVDRSAAYMGRYVAKNVVAAGLAPRCEVQIAYCIGVAEPVSVLVSSLGTSDIPDEVLTKAVREVFRPAPLPHHEAPRSAPPHLQEDLLLRPLRPRTPRIHVGTYRRSRRSPHRREGLSAARTVILSERSFLSVKLSA